MFGTHDTDHSMIPILKLIDFGAAKVIPQEEPRPT